MHAIHIVELIIAVMSGYALIRTWKVATQTDWSQSSLWRRMSFVAGWMMAAGAVAAWLAWVYVMVANLMTAMNPSMPKPPAIIYFVLGGLIYMMLVGFSRSAFDASAGSAEDDIRDRLGR